LRVVICWTGISGYLTACWRALAARPGIDLHVICFPVVGNADAPFASDVTEGLSVTAFAPDDVNNPDKIATALIALRPEVVVIAGWAIPAYNALLTNPALATARFAMAMDTPRKDNWRQKFARFRLGKFRARVERVIVPGERSYRFARQIGFTESQIRRGMNGYDDAPLAPLHARRAAQPWPRRFLFVGRYVPAKGIDTLLAAYAAYRAAVSEPWLLTCCGTGPLKSQITAAPGVTDQGFVQPKDQPAVFADHGVFVLASHYEPWGVAMAEAMAAGLPAICTEACGASVELVRPFFNGLLTATADASSLARALRWFHDHADRLPDMGLHARHAALAFSAQAWAERWDEMCQELR
jgi:glycosyltransferase involved in cell wall biosynthesis